MPAVLDETVLHEVDRAERGRDQCQPLIVVETGGERQEVPNQVPAEKKRSYRRRIAALVVLVVLLSVIWIILVALVG